MHPILPALLALLLAACEPLGIPDPEKQAAAAEAEGRAIGSACRQSGRALEDCFTLNPGATKAAIFDGWRSMNDYMTENHIAEVKPTLPAANMLMPRPRAAENEGGATGEHAAEGGKAAHEPTAEKADGEAPRRPRSRTLRSQQDH